jgi:hypothetical protein
VKLRHGRRITGWAAQLGTVIGRGETRAEALADLEREVVGLTQRVDRGMTRGEWHGYAWQVVPRVTAWAYEWCDGGRWVYPVGPYETREDAEEAVLHHLAQLAWAPVMDDETYTDGLPLGIRGDVRHWIRWQRSYASLRAEGKTETEAHRMASGW